MGYTWDNFDDGGFRFASDGRRNQSVGDFRSGGWGEGVLSRSKFIRAQLEASTAERMIFLRGGWRRTTKPLLLHRPVSLFCYHRLKKVRWYIVSDAILDHIDGVADKKAKELSNFLGMLRSAAVSDNEDSKKREAHGDWKVKQDTQEYHVMYREGPESTPYHTLLVEGYVNGPLDVCLCISTESSL